MRLTENFWLNEFDCKDGTKVPEDLVGNVIELAKNLQSLRDYLGSTIRVNSSYRHEEYNASVGGGKKSQHLLAKAADIVSPDYTPSQIHCAIEKLITSGEMTDGGLGLYNSFVHYDVRGYNARWDKTNK
jgi:uncharacterized protein YcbK (DUF882 family)